MTADERFLKSMNITPAVIEPPEVASVPALIHAALRRAYDRRGFDCERARANAREWRQVALILAAGMVVVMIAEMAGWVR